MATKDGSTWRRCRFLGVRMERLLVVGYKSLLVRPRQDTHGKEDCLDSGIALFDWCNPDSLSLVSARFHPMRSSSSATRAFRLAMEGRELLFGWKEVPEMKIPWPHCGKVLVVSLLEPLIPYLWTKSHIAMFLALSI
ncbi:uncharacterized protein CIMG_13267 [Coccidioides immitis RS]|uniref:Uncharacterized protein n=1 Tax=Coccidioides immitis (strain RS) TaxID=246410 RepID=A0A0D8JUM6_COCIM|nr:uncharacterized protein CIMG_13267 [Coccidioides immitis RS]KJF60834.1 hypothetical protein CIMG_13267 [Coccidioides immitis RS]